MNVPIPNNPAEYKTQDPRPQEAAQHYGNDLEYDLQNGSDMMMQRR